MLVTSIISLGKLRLAPVVLRWAFDNFTLIDTLFENGNTLFVFLVRFPVDGLVENHR